jgi:hypothetical protein
MTYDTIVSSKNFISYKNMLIKDDVRNSVIYFVAEGEEMAEMKGGHSRKKLGLLICKN